MIEVPLVIIGSKYTTHTPYDASSHKVGDMSLARIYAANLTKVYHNQTCKVKDLQVFSKLVESD